MSTLANCSYKLSLRLLGSSTVLNYVIARVLLFANHSLQDSVKALFIVYKLLASVGSAVSGIVLNVFTL